MRQPAEAAANGIDQEVMVLVRDVEKRVNASARRQELHGRVAAAVEEPLAASLGDHLELIAHH